MAHPHPALSQRRANEKPILRLSQPLVLKRKPEADLSEIRFRRLVENMNEAVWVGDDREHTVYANPKFCEMMEYSLEEMLGRPSYDFWTPESVERVKKVNHRDRKQGISSSYEGELLTRTGKRIPVLLSGTPLPDGGTIGIMTDLREIKRREAQVENLLSRFDLAVTGSNDGLWYTEIPTKLVRGRFDFINSSDYCVWFSPRHREILGYSESEYPDILGSWVGHIHPEDAPRVLEILKLSLRLKTSFEVEYRIRHKNGQYLWAATRGSAKLNKSGTQILLAGSFRDVTERKKMRESLAKRVRESHLLYQANAHMRMVHPIRRVFSDLAKDLAHTCDQVPYAFTRIEFDGHVFSKPYLKGKAVERIRESIIVRGQKRGFLEIIYLKCPKANGSVFNDDKQALVTLGNFIRKHVSSREIMGRYQSLVKKSTMGVFILQDGLFRFANPKFARLFRVRGTQLIDKSYQPFILADLGNGTLPSPRRFVAKGRRSDGIMMDLDVHIQPLEYHGHRAILGTVEDITKVMAAETRIKHFNQELRQKVKMKTQDLEQANRRLQSLNELKDEFIAVTSHELRSPLTAVRGYLSFIVEDQEMFQKLPEDVRNYIIRVHDNVGVLNNLVNNILDVSRIETGRLEIYKKPCDIVDLVEETVRHFSYQLGEKKLTAVVNNRLTPDRRVLPVDSIRIRQVFRNILDNAIKYSPPNKKIVFEIEARGIGVQISLMDEGIGIPKSQIFDVFDKFKQGKNAQSSYKGGAGLGLFIAKKIMEIHGGMIWAESQLNKGTTFRIQLPMN